MKTQKSEGLSPTFEGLMGEIKTNKTLVSKVSDLIENEDPEIIMNLINFLIDVYGLKMNLKLKRK